MDSNNLPSVLSTDPVAEKAIVVGLFESGIQKNGDDAPATFIDELQGLAEAAGVDVVASLVQHRSAPHPATCLGQGKVEELKVLVEMHEADVVIFNNDLLPSQAKNLEEELKVKVLDRTELILDIFALRAQTYQARLAVELAQLEYSMPRLKRMWTHLSRQTQGGVGLRGPGEKQLEVDRRLAQKRINALKNDLEVIHKRKQREVSGRKGSNTVSLVGYTNAGKSTLLNALTGSEEFVKDQLFATLDTRTRRWEIPTWGRILLSDTVGFIRNLPHHLVASFRATLEEAVCADLLIHVADGSNPAVFTQIQAVNNVLQDLGIDEKQTLLIINKADGFAPWDENGNDNLAACLEEKLQLGDISGIARYRKLKEMYPHALFISAEKKLGFDNLIQRVTETLSQNYACVELIFSSANGKLLAELSQNGEILSQEFFDNGTVRIECRIPERFLKTLPVGVRLAPLKKCLFG